VIYLFITFSCADMSVHDCFIMPKILKPM